MKTPLLYISALLLCLSVSTCDKGIEEPIVSNPNDMEITFSDFEITLQDITDTHVCIVWESCGTDAKYDLFIDGKRIANTLSDQGYGSMYYELNTLSPATTYRLNIRSMQNHNIVKYAYAEFTTEKTALISRQFITLDPYEYEQYEWTDIRVMADGGLLGIANTRKHYGSYYRTLVKWNKNGETEWLHDYANPQGNTFSTIPATTHFNKDGTLLLVNWDYVLHLNAQGELLQCYPFYEPASDAITLMDARITAQGNLLAIGYSYRNGQKGEKPYCQYYTALVNADGTQKKEYFNGTSDYNKLLKMEMLNENTYLTIGSNDQGTTLLTLNAEGIIEQEKNLDIGGSENQPYFSFRGSNGELYFAGAQTYWPGGYQNFQSFLLKFSPEGTIVWQQFYPQSVGYFPSLKSIKMLEKGGFILTATDDRGYSILLTDDQGVVKWALGIKDSAGLGHLIYTDIDEEQQLLTVIGSYGAVVEIDLRGYIKDPFLKLE